MAYTCKKYARDERTARAVLAAVGCAFFDLSPMEHHNKARLKLVGRSYQGADLYVIIDKRGSTDLETVKIYDYRHHKKRHFGAQATLR